MREKNVESAFIDAVKGQGGLALKLVSPGFNGMPDRLVIFPGGIIAFVEVKAPGKKPGSVTAFKTQTAETVRLQSLYSG